MMKKERRVNEKIKALLLKQGDEVYIGHFCVFYRAKHGSNVVMGPRATLSGCLEALTALGLFDLEYRSNKTSLWLALPKLPTKKSKLAEQIKTLLVKQGGEAYVGVFAVYTENNMEPNCGGPRKNTI